MQKCFNGLFEQLLLKAKPKGRFAFPSLLEMPPTTMETTSGHHFSLGVCSERNKQAGVKMCFIQYSADPEKWIGEQGAAEFFKTYRLHEVSIHRMKH